MRYNTGNPVEPNGSSDPRDLYDTAAIADLLVNGPLGEYLSRLGVPLKSWRGIMKQVTDYLIAQGYESVYLVYGAGVIVQRQTQLIQRSGELYRVMNAADIPLTLTGTWATDLPKLQAVGDAALRSALAATDSSVLVGGATAGSIGKIAGALSVDADGRVRTTKIAVGTNPMTGSAVRDAIGVYRNLTGETDAHGFVEHTVIDGVTDYGGYGSVDVTTILRGSNNQNHLFSYQSRPEYAGSGNIQHLADFLARPVHSGTGVINERIGIDVGDLTVTNGGLVDQQIGVYIRNLNYGTAKVALNIGQSQGLALYAPGGARSYHAGPFRVGVDDVSTVPFSVGVAGSPNFYILPQAGSATAGVSGDSFLRLATNAVTRVEIGNAASQSVLRPGADNAQPLGDATKRWSAVFAGSGTINTSDAREKTKVRQLTAAEIAAATQLAKEIGAFRFLAAVAEKGDGAREHIGMTVQRAREILEQHGLDPFSYSFICYDKWGKQVIEHEAQKRTHPAVYRKTMTVDMGGNPFNELVTDEWEEVTAEAWTEVLQEAGDRYSFRMDGLTAFIIAGFEARLSALEV